MKDHVTVIPSDHIVIVDGFPLRFSFDAPANLHALQWHEGKGEMEFTDSDNQQFTGEEYAENVAPYVEAWEKEKSRLDAEAEKQAKEANTPERLAEAIRKERNARIAATDYLMLPDYPLTEEKRSAWEQYRVALRGITDLEGFPWEGPESAPWPDIPVL
jgi:hypothetical protein